MSENFVLQDFSQQVMNDCENQLYKALEEIGLRAVGYASDLTPVGETGRLKNSMTYTTRKVKGKTIRTIPQDDGTVKETKEAVTTDTDFAVIVGSNVHYAPYIEYGHHSYRPKHMIKNAISNHIDEYRKVLKKNLENK